MTTLDPGRVMRVVDLLVEAPQAAELAAASVEWPSWHLTPRQLCDLELLSCGGFSPLASFLGRADYESVCDSMRLVDGSLWPMPIMLDLPDETIASIGPAGKLALRDPEGLLLAVISVDEVWRPDLQAEAAAVYGTTDVTHPGVWALRHGTNPSYVAGRLEIVRMPAHYDSHDLRKTPAELRAEFRRRGWSRVVAFQTRNPMHRAHQQLTLRAAQQADAKLLIHPIAGIGRPGDIDYLTRVRCYRALLPSYPPGTVLLSLLPLAMRMGGPREALWHALIRRNYGATHFIVGRDHAGPGPDRTGRSFYPPYRSHELLDEHAAEIGMEILSYKRMMYLPDRDAYLPEDEVPAGARALSISGTELRARLAEGEDLPSWFTPPEVAAELRHSCPPRSAQGFAVLLTGLSGAGKSTIAHALETLLRDRSGRAVTLLDGDVVRQHLSSDLGFSREDRNRNIARIGFVAAEIVKHRGIVICAPIAPYEAARQAVADLVSAHGGFLLIHVSTPLEICQARDPKGLYSKAVRGMLAEFTGVSDPYEIPEHPDLVIETELESADTAAHRIVTLLEARGYLTEADVFIEEPDAPGTR
jgi:sulfate adenylyltransferase